MSLEQFVERGADDEATVTVLNRDSPSSVYRLLAGLFDDDAVTVREADAAAEAIPPDTVFLRREETDTGLAVSPLDAIRDQLLLVNSDIYVTGTRGLEDVDTPAVITALDEIPFTVRGDYEHAKEKLLLIELSRHIEARAWRAGEGRLATGFQYLSRLDDERGTRRVYERLGEETDVDTHVYGAPDADPSISSVTVHGVADPEIRRTWFVAHRSATHAHEAAGLVAVERDPRTWEAYWTYDPERVDDVFDYLESRYN